MVGLIVAGVIFCIFGILVIATRNLTADMRVKWYRRYFPYFSVSRRFHLLDTIFGGVAMFALGVLFIVIGILSS